MAEGPLEIEDLPGVGPSTAEKLREAGYLSVESIATAFTGRTFRDLGNLGVGGKKDCQSRT